MLGTDISQYQGEVDYALVEANARIVFCRASFGAPDAGQSEELYVDPQFHRNQYELRTLGLTRGYYHFAYPEYNSASAEAKQFINTVGALQEGEMIALDYERQVKDPVTWCKDWLDSVSAHYGVKPFIYLNLNTVRSFDWSSVSSTYPLWIAEWDNNDSAPVSGVVWPAGIPLRQYGLVNWMHADGDIAYSDLSLYGAKRPVAILTDAPITHVEIFAPFKVDLQPTQIPTPEIKRMQEYLIAKGFMTASDIGGNFGYYGKHTQDAVHAFQVAHGITKTSEYGWWYPVTRAAANSDLSISSTSNA